jgi:hypothetical protein
MTITARAIDDDGNEDNDDDERDLLESSRHGSPRS